jgi:amino acid permease
MTQVHPAGINLGPKIQAGVGFQPAEAMGIAKHLQHHISSLDLCSLGVITVLSGHLIGWDARLTAGVGSLALAYLLVAVGSCCYLVSLAHIMKTMPLSGGIFIFTRVLVGFLPGYLLGCMQILLYLLLTAITASRLVHAILLGLFDIQDTSFAPLLFIVVYTIAAAIYLLNGKVFWGFSLVSCIFAMIFILVFIFGSFKYADSDNYTRHGSQRYAISGYIDGDPTAQASDWFIGGISNFLHIFPRSLWFFMGLESMLYSVSDVKEAGKLIPRSMLTSTAIVLVISLFLVGLLPSLPRLVHDHSSASLDSAIAVVYQLALHLQQRYAYCLVIPIHLASMVAFLSRSSKVLAVIVSANLLPKLLSTRFFLSAPWCWMPIPAIALVNLIALGLSLLSWHQVWISRHLENLVFLCYFLTASTITVSYYLMLRKFGANISISYQRVGFTVSIICSLISLLGIVAVIGFQKDQGLVISIISVFLLACLISYFLYAKKRQKFTSEEMKLTFTSLVVKFNTQLRNRVKKGQSPGSSKRSSGLWPASLSIHRVISACSPKVQSSVSKALGYVQTLNASSRESKMSSKSISISASSHGHVSRRVSGNLSTRRSVYEGTRIEITATAANAALACSSPLMSMSTLNVFKSSLRSHEQVDETAPQLAKSPSASTPPYLTDEAAAMTVTSPFSGSILKQPHRALSNKNLGILSPSHLQPSPSFHTQRKPSFRRTMISSTSADAVDHQLFIASLSQPGSMAASRNNSQASAVDMTAMSTIMNHSPSRMSLGMKKPSVGNMSRHKSHQSASSANLRIAAIQTWAEVGEDNSPRLMDLTPPIPIPTMQEAFYSPSFLMKHPSTSTTAHPHVREDMPASGASSVRSTYSIQSTYSFHSLALSPDLKKNFASHDELDELG